VALMLLNPSICPHIVDTQKKNTPQLRVSLLAKAQ